MKTMTDGTALLSRVRARITVSEDPLLKQAFADLEAHMHSGGRMPEPWVPEGRKVGRPPLGDGEVLDGVTHGIYAGYREGCRCYRCRRANADRAINYRKGAENESTTD